MNRNKEKKLKKEAEYLRGLVADLSELTASIYVSTHRKHWDRVLDCSETVFSKNTIEGIRNTLVQIIKSSRELTPKEVKRETE